MVLSIHMEAERKMKKEIAYQQYREATYVQLLQYQEHDEHTFPVSSSHNTIAKLKTSAL